MATNIEIDGDGWRFQPRVAAVCVRQDRVQLRQSLDGGFWVLPALTSTPGVISTPTLTSTPAVTSTPACPAPESL